MKKFILGIFIGAIISTGIVVAVEYNIYPNPYRILVNGQEKQVEAYNVNDKTYIQLRDIATALGNVIVDFKEETILIDDKKEDNNTVDSKIESGIQRTSDGLKIEDDGGIVKSSLWEKYDRTIYSLLPNKNGTLDFDKLGTVILSDIPMTANGNIPLDYYESTLRPFLEELE